MYRVLKTSWASWRREHGFGVIRVIDPKGEIFEVAATAAGTLPLERVARWRGRSEAELRLHLLRAGRQAREIDQAIAVAREWTTAATLVDKLLPN